jgi:hypothetical protein
VQHARQASVLVQVAQEWLAAAASCRRSGFAAERGSARPA